jgi:hypothetical protein
VQKNNSGERDMFDFLYRDDADYVTDNLRNNPPVAPPVGGMGPANRTEAIAAFAGYSMTNDGIWEPPHVSIILFWPQHYIKTDLYDNAGRVGINVGNPIADFDTLPNSGMSRVFLRTAAQVNAALALANGYHANPPNRAYSKRSGPWTLSWNCAEYAEKILRAAGVNCSAGAFIASPLELTTGRSLLPRLFNRAQARRAGPGLPWPRRYQR